jgi:hypothetical protein
MQCACTVLYCHLGSARLYNIFPQDLTNGTIFEKKLPDIKCVFWFSLSVTEPEAIKNVYWSSCYCYFCLILMKLEFSLQIFEKYSNIKFHEEPSGGSQTVPCGWMDSHHETNSRFSHFCECAYNSLYIATNKCMAHPCYCRSAAQFNLLKTKRNLLYLKNQSVPRCKHFPSWL